MEDREEESEMEEREEGSEMEGREDGRVNSREIVKHYVKYMFLVSDLSQS